MVQINNNTLLFIIIFAISTQALSHYIPNVNVGSLSTSLFPGRNVISHQHRQVIVPGTGNNFAQGSISFNRGSSLLNGGAFIVGGGDSSYGQGGNYLGGNDLIGGQTGSSNIVTGTTGDFGYPGDLGTGEIDSNGSFPTGEIGLNGSFPTGEIDPNGSFPIGGIDPNGSFPTDGTSYGGNIITGGTGYGGNIITSGTDYSGNQGTFGVSGSVPYQQLQTDISGKILTKIVDGGTRVTSSKPTESIHTSAIKYIVHKPKIVRTKNHVRIVHVKTKPKIIIKNRIVNKKVYHDVSPIIKTKTHINVVHIQKKPKIFLKHKNINKYVVHKPAAIVTSKNHIKLVHLQRGPNRIVRHKYFKKYIIDRPKTIYRTKTHVQLVHVRGDPNRIVQQRVVRNYIVHNANAIDGQITDNSTGQVYRGGDVGNQVITSVSPSTQYVGIPCTTTQYVGTPSTATQYVGTPSTVLTTGQTGLFGVYPGSTTVLTTGQNGSNTSTLLNQSQSGLNGVVVGGGNYQRGITGLNGATTAGNSIFGLNASQAINGGGNLVIHHVDNKAGAEGEIGSSLSNSGYGSSGNCDNDTNFDNDPFFNSLN